jgi:hypothetical protein
MSFQLSSDAIRWARTDNGISKAVLVALADIAGNDGACFPSIDLIAKRVEFSRKSVMRAMVELEAHGHLTAVRSRRGNRYVVHPVLDRSESPPQGHQKQEPETPVVPSRDFSSPQQGLHKSPTGTSVVPHRDTKQSVSNQEATKVSNHLASAAANAGEVDSLFPIEPPPPKPKREPKPKPKPEGTTDPRHHEITSRIGAAFSEVMEVPFIFSTRFAKEIATFLRQYPGTADDFLAMYQQMLKAGRMPYANATKKAADPCFLARNWNACVVELENIAGQYHSQPKKR